MKAPLKTGLILTAVGGTLGPMLDALHTYSGAIWYTEPQLFRSVWWCPPLFAFAGLAIGLPRVYIDVALDGRVLTPSRGAVAWKMGLFFVGYALSGFLPAAWWVKAVLLLTFFVLALWPKDTRGVFPGAVGAAFGGWLVEYLLTSRGFFVHRDGQLAGVAGWIPPLYMLAAAAVGALARLLWSSAATSSPSHSAS